MSDELMVWTIFHNPLDHPGKWVLRSFTVRPLQVQPSADCVVADSLEQVRAALPGGVYLLPRDLLDDPAIYESWV
jgi:hypothetical protein